MIPPQVLLTSIREQQRERWREAEVLHRRQQARAGQPRLRDRGLRALGQCLVLWGSWLQQLARPVTPQGQHGRVTCTSDVLA
jgi:hypothetical protein